MTNAKSTRLVSTRSQKLLTGAIKNQHRRR